MLNGHLFECCCKECVPIVDDTDIILAHEQQDLLHARVSRKMKQGNTLLTERRHKRVLRCHLPYVIGKDYTRLVRLTRIWQRAIQKGRYGHSLYTLSQQCESLYYKVYGTGKYQGDKERTMYPLPLNMLISEYNQHGIGYCAYCYSPNCYGHCR